MFLIRLVSALEKSDVDYAVVGGYAVALHGAVRGTVDIDLAIRFSEEDFVKAEKVFKSLGLESRLPVGGAQVFKFRKEYIENRNLVAWSFYNPKHPVEAVDVIITYDRAKMQTKNVQFQGKSIKIASINDLIKMKSKTGRPQDQSDIDALRKILK
jgi:hypothetical protein